MSGQRTVRITPVVGDWLFGARIFDDAGFELAANVGFHSRAAAMEWAKGFIDLPGPQPGLAPARFWVECAVGFPGRSVWQRLDVVGNFGSFASATAAMEALPNRFQLIPPPYYRVVGEAL